MHLKLPLADILPTQPNPTTYSFECSISFDYDKKDTKTDTKTDIKTDTRIDTKTDTKTQKTKRPLDSDLKQIQAEKKTQIWT